MHKTLSFVRLDFVTIKPYFSLKNLAVMIAAPLVLLISTDVSIVTVGMFVIFAALYVSYPFVIGEKNGMDALYPTLSITRKTVVIGRYLFAFAFDVCAGVVGIAFSVGLLLIMQKPIAIFEIALTMLATLVVVTFIEAFQLPIYFKLGYEKAKLIAYFPFIGFWIATLVGGKLLPKDGGLPDSVINWGNWLAANVHLSVFLGMVLWFGLMVISCSLSIAYYRKRDF